MDNFNMKNIDLEVLEYGHYFGGANWKHYNVTSSFNRLYFVLNGEGYIKNSKEEIHLKPGMVYLVPLNSTYDYICNDKIEKFYIHFRLNLFNYKDIFEFFSSCLSLPYEKDLLISILEKRKEKDISAALSLQSFILKYLSLFIDNLSVNENENIEILMKYHRIFTYIKENLSAKLTTNKILQNLNIPSLSFSRNFKKDLGITLNKYIDLMIIQYAKDKILLTDMNIKEISYSLGFCDEFYFSRFFKKHTKISPSEYRNQNKMKLY